jgi:NhaP-type Na+/H+ or K+/H+ antiporter
VDTISTELFLSTLALSGAVIVVAALLSGTVERTGLPQVAVFLALGAILGPGALALLDVGVESPLLRVLSTLSLVLVLFTDAVSLNLKEIRQHKLLTFIVVGPGTVITALLISVAAWRLLGLSPPLAVILGAALSSTDPVLLRGLVRRPELDPPVRQALRLESGLNDVVLLPIVLVAMALVRGSGGDGDSQLGPLALRMFILSPAAGIGVGLAAIGALDLVRRRIGVRRDYESIYSLGVALLAYAAAETMHGSGFLAAFAAGLTIAALDVELCDCFVEYGETTAEMALLFTFVLFGTSLIWSGLTILTPASIAFVALVVVLRPVALVPALATTALSWRNRWLIAWFGPRGLSSLILVLLPIFAGVPGSGALLPVCCLVVLCSVVLHGASPMVLLRRGPTVDGPSVDAEPPITIDDIQAMQNRGATPIVADARSESTYESSTEVIPQAVRLRPASAVADAERLGIPRDQTIAVLCA